MRTLSDLPIQSYVLIEVDARENPHDLITLERCQQRDNSFLWAIRRLRYCLNRGGDWVWEPIPSSRDKSFTARCRWLTAEEALAFFERWRESQ